MNAAATRFSRSPLIALLLAALAIVCACETHALFRQRAEIARERARVATLEAGLHAARIEAEATRFSVESARAALAAAQANEATPENREIKNWAGRTRKLKDAILSWDEVRIPELALVDPLDWLLAGRVTAFDSSLESFDAAKALEEHRSLRSVARRKFGDLLQAALARYLEGSGGLLPTSITQLAPYLPPPIDAAMLARYEMIATGKLSSSNAYVIAEKTEPDLAGETLLKVGPRNWVLESDPTATLPSLDLPEAPEPDLVAVENAAKRYASAHGGRKPETFFDLSQHLSDQEVAAVLESVRVTFAMIEYTADHNGALATSAAQLKPYLDRPYDIEARLRALKIDIQDSPPAKPEAK